MKFHPINLNKWARAPYYNHYMQHVRCTFSMTAELDLTTLLTEVRARGIKLYPVLIHMLATVVNRHQAFRTWLDDEGRLGYWEQVWPAYTVFHEEDQTFSSIWTPYEESFPAFYESYQHDTRTYGNVRKLAAKPDEPPHTFPVSSITWVNFTSFNLNIHNEGLFLRPIFTMGQYAEHNGATRLPLSIQLHHAVCDGYHAGLLYRELQERADQCREWLP
ncbi:type A chloramphenicol O-acetyltransferase [Paenibacillus daejeonensis]|uniref:type A chloramphenicol O-acetyltransferase n=1 Tax=Paenibacillus daejeonensis TaxID=135193 RepID=UPI00037831EC|nr:type A chloramphenicol O-acetyltransferase [Paenibacillus daejeonensis]